MTRAMKAANKPQYAAITLLGFLCLATYSYGVQAKRVTCEDLGRCNLKTGEVYDMGDVSTRKDEAAKALESSPAKPVKLVFGSPEWVEITRYAFSED